MIIEAGKSQICRVGWQAGNPERDNVVLQGHRPSAAEFPLARRAGDGSQEFT